MTHLKGEALNGSIQLEFHVAKVTSDGGLLAHRDLDDAVGLLDSVSTDFHDNHTGRNIQHELLTLLRQSIYPESFGTGYEDVNDAERLSIDPVIRECCTTPWRLFLHS